MLARSALACAWDQAERHSGLDEGASTSWPRDLAPSARPQRPTPARSKRHQAPAFVAGCAAPATTMARGRAPPPDLQRAAGRAHDVGVLDVRGGRMRQLDEFLDPKLGARPRGKRHLMPVCCDDGVCAGRLAAPPSQQGVQEERRKWSLALWSLGGGKLTTLLTKHTALQEARGTGVCDQV